MPLASLNKVNIYHEVTGQGDPLILRAGFTQDHTRWDHVIDSLAPHFQVLAFDNRGVGQSDAPDESYGLEDMADDLSNLLDSLGIEKAHILGHSMGSAIAQCFAFKYPEKVKNLILYATFPKLDSVGAFFFETLHVLMKRDLETKTFVDLILPWVFSNKFVSSEENIQAVRNIVTSNPHPLTEDKWKLF